VNDNRAPVAVDEPDREVDRDRDQRRHLDLAICAVEGCRSATDHPSGRCAWHRLARDINDDERKGGTK
jgi:hypothetical protein